MTIGIVAQTAGSKRIHAIQALQKKVVLFINLRGKDGKN